MGEDMKVKVIDEGHEKDLEDEINAFIEDKEVYDIKFSTAVAVSGEDQIFCFSALIVYKRRVYEKEYIYARSNYSNTCNSNK